MRFPIVALPLMALLLPSAVLAQTSVEGRVGRLEQEMQAVQRKVFPDGAGRYLQPQVTTPQGVTAAPGTPAASQVTDLNARVSAVEAALRSLTGQVEQNGFKIKQLEQSFAQYKSDMAAGAGAAAAPESPAPAIKP
ncbi:MAG TPA: hypothetical protein VF463_07980, partial [Sphingobium sp.]